MAKRKAPQAGADASTSEPAPPSQKLTPSQEIFCLHYAQKKNATTAYAAGWPEAAYNTCRVEGCKLLTKPNIKEKIEMLMEQEREKLNFTLEDYFRIIYRIATDDEHKRQLDAVESLYEKFGLGKNKEVRRNAVESILEVVENLKR